MTHPHLCYTSSMEFGSHYCCLNRLKKKKEGDNIFKDNDSVKQIHIKDNLMINFKLSRQIMKFMSRV